MHRWDKWNLEQDKLEDLLVQEVKNLPIITRRSQELWLGIQIKSPRRWQSLLETEDRVKLSTIYASLYDEVRELEKSCEMFEIFPPDISQWILELLAGQRNIYDLRHSKLRRFIRQTAKNEKSPDSAQAVIDTSYKCAELLAILPQKVLRYLSEFQRLPLPEVLEKQILRKSFISDYPRQAIYQQARKAKNVLVAGHSRYALRIAYRYVNQGIDYLDLVQAAFLGLIRAAKKFDYQKHTRFAIYASTWMWQKVKRTIANQSRVIRIPVYVRTQIQEIQETYENFWEEKKREPNFDELLLRSAYLEEKDIKRIEQCHAKGIPLPEKLQQRYQDSSQELRLRLKRSCPILSLESICENDQDALTNQPTFPMQKSLNRIARSSLMKRVYKLITNFSERDQKILRMRFGLDTGKDHTLAEIGEEFDLTRERIRQIETQILDYLARKLPEQLWQDYRSSRVWSLSSDLNIPLTTKKLFPNREQIRSQDWTWLGQLLEELPGGDWHHKQGASSREEQLIEALQTLKEPAHYSDIAEQLNDMLEQENLEDRYIYSQLFNHEDSFILLGEGVFSLTSWEKKRGEAPVPVLPFCPTILPDEQEREYVFLESVLVAQNILKQELTVNEFLERIFAWAGIEEAQSTWLLQSVLSAYYSIGVIPYTFYPDAKSEILVSTMPEIGLQELRRYCLRMMTQRIIAMPQFWWLMQRYEPARACDITEHFINVHPLGLDDTLKRLELLTSIGATQKSRYARFRLNGLGQESASQFGEPPNIFDEETDTSSSNTEDINSLDLITF